MVPVPEIVPLRLAWNCVKANNKSLYHWQASLVLGRVSVCGKPIVSISSYQSEIIDFTWLKVCATTYRDLGGNRLLCPRMTGNVPFDLSRFLEEVRRTERCARKHVGPFENVSYSVGVSNGYLTRHEDEEILHTVSCRCPAETKA